MVTHEYAKLNHGEESLFDLTNVYNREHTTGLMDKQKSIDLVNLERPNNNGIEIGEVVGIQRNNNKNLGFYENVISINTNQDINKLDVLRYIGENYEDGQIVEQFEVGNNVIIYSNSKPKIGAKVFRTYNENLYKECMQLTNKFNRRVNINVDIQIIDMEVFIYLNDDMLETNLSFEIGIKKTVSQEEFISVLQKTKNTPFDLNINVVNYENNYFMTNKNIKEIKNIIINFFFI